MNAPAGVRSVAERLVAASASLSSGAIPARVRLRCEDLLVDTGGLCVFEERQPHIRGGVHEPLTREEIERKFRSNARYGGWDAARAERFLQFARNAFDRPVDLSGFRG